MMESFLRTATLNVPWPVLEVSRVVIDDSASGDGDGVLDPDESAELEIYVLNSGDLSTFRWSRVRCPNQEGRRPPQPTRCKLWSAYGW